MAKANPSTQGPKREEDVPLFVREVAKYFMSFLETDFKKRRIPKRNTIKKIQNGLKIAIDLDKYLSLKKVILNNLNDGFHKESLAIKKGHYKTSIPATLLDLISRKIDKISKDDLKIFFSELADNIYENRHLYAKEHDKFVEESIEGAKKILTKKIILPLLDDLDKPLENLELADENSKYQLEIDIVDTIFASINTSFNEVLQRYSVDESALNIKKELKNIVILDELKNNLSSFFKTFGVADAYLDLYQLFRNNKLIDKSEIYLYFYEIGLGNEKFPVLYLPLTIEKDEDQFRIQFDNRIFVNTKAIDFVVQEYNLQVKQKATLTGEFERIIYLHESIKFNEQLEKSIRKLENFFALNRNIEITNPILQKGVNLIVSLSNKSYFYLFDRSDEALINDYEEILNDGAALEAKFNELLNSFIEENPKSFIQDVDDAWSEKEIPEKLIIESPIPLNDEQKKVLMALGKPDCKFLVLEGPPGTGKSHTITSVICKALLEEKSVLVLSDKKEALDVVEEKISTTLNKIRHEEDFQNPILRLGRSGNKFNSIVQGQTIQKIKEHYRAYKDKKGEYDAARRESVKILTSSIQDNIDYFKKISMDDIFYYFNNEEKYGGINWITKNDDLTKLKPELINIYKIISKLRKHKNIPLKSDWLSQEVGNTLEQTLTLFRNIETIKSKLNTNRPIDLKETDNQTSKSLETIQKNIKKFLDWMAQVSPQIPNDITNTLHHFDNKSTLKDLKDNFENFINKNSLLKDFDKYLGGSLEKIDLIDNFSIPEGRTIEDAISALSGYVQKLEKLRKPILGYLFEKEKLTEAKRILKKVFEYLNLENPEKELTQLKNLLDFFEYIKTKNLKLELENNGIVYLVNETIKKYYEKPREDYDKLTDLIKHILTLLNSFDNYDEYTLKEFGRLVEIIDLKIAIDTVFEKKELLEKLTSLKLDISLKHLLHEKLDVDIRTLDDYISKYRLAIELKDDLDYLSKFASKYPKVTEAISLNHKQIISEINCDLLGYSVEELETFFKFKEAERKLENQFCQDVQDSYLDKVANLEDLVTAEMTYFLDKRIIEYTYDYAGEVNTLKGIIKKKQKFPKHLFNNLKKAFPCILAGIRDYAEYIPLEKDLFDLIIIDEASQVSIAQSLPALIRGKQVVVLGDDKQFSNVKANNASKVTNQELKTRVEEAFRLEKGSDADKYGWMNKVKENFDVKNSILKFMRFIRNYDCQLKKHFRCYPEIISYSDKNFYNNTLQCMKVRGIPIEEVIQFDIIEHDGKFDESKNTNELEVTHIIKLLKKHAEKKDEHSLGIITPHREQVTLLFDKVNDLPERDWLFGKCKLKIMTFDTCQGEERDIIYYSMVATKEKDQLNWIFPVDFSRLKEEVEGTVKAQRLNVGFSRAKECIHFILSKQPEEFKGEIKNALLHYKNLLADKNKLNSQETDINSPMEQQIKHYFYQTEFYKSNKENIEFMPQFPLGEYLQRLDRNYSHPKYKVDFLMLYNMEKIVIEYDGFKEHFGNSIDLDDIDSSNYEIYMNEEDVYRQKVLEGYGYKFVRINKFNLGNNPIESINTMLYSCVKKNFKTRPF